MSDVFDVVEGARPDVDPIPPDARRRFREELFHDGRRTPDATAEAALVVPWQTRRRSRQLVILVALLLVGGIVAMFLLRGDEDDGTSTAASTSPASPTTDPPPEEVSRFGLPVEFTPLLLDSVPDGYRLHWARYDGNFPADTVGLARYVRDQGGPEIVILLRAEPDAYTGELADDAKTWRVKGRRVAADPPTGQCLDSTCGVNVQWDDDTALTVSWVNWDGSSLGAEVDPERLVDLVRDLTTQPDRWEAGPIDQENPAWRVPDRDAAPLFLPGDDTNLVSAVHRAPWPGSSSVAIRAADGTVITVREGDGGATAFDEAELIRQGAVAVVPPADVNVLPLVYNLEVRCGFAHIADEPRSEIMRPTIQQLLDAMTVDRGEIAVRLRDGWSRLAGGEHAGVHDVVFNVPIEGQNREVTLRQSPGGAASDFLFGRGPVTEIDFAGETAWTVAEGARTIVIGRRGATAFEISAGDTTVEQLEAAYAALRPATVEDWTARWGLATTPGLDSDCPQQPYLVVRRAE